MLEMADQHVQPVSIASGVGIEEPRGCVEISRDAPARRRRRSRAGPRSVARSGLASPRFTGLVVGLRAHSHDSSRSSRG